MTEYISEDTENGNGSCRSSRMNRTKLKFRGRTLLEYSISQIDVKRIDSFLSGSPMDITNDETTVENAEEVYKRTGTVINRKTGDTVRFVNSVSGKIEKHRDDDPGLIGELFEKAVFLFDEDPDFVTPRSNGTLHKKKKIVGFSSCGSLIGMDGLSYIVRYTVQEPDTRSRKDVKNFHSQQISGIKNSTRPHQVHFTHVRGMVKDASDCRFASFPEVVNMTDSQPDCIYQEVTLN